ncbi:helix-turn-helix transcriptional regulator [Streptomyces sp. NPDC051976]|uniref:helix-turn-helix transcriptional regulator n=1 Tax=Streptomyces sp. NPDC051976 TaxID=3154947 RepID=UPI00341A5D00
MGEDELGAVLRARRGSVGLTQEELAALSGLSVRAVRDLERGKVARPRRETVRLLATALGLGHDDREELLRLAGHVLQSGQPLPGSGTPAAPADGDDPPLATGPRAGPAGAPTRAAGSDQTAHTRGTKSAARNAVVLAARRTWRPAQRILLTVLLMAMVFLTADGSPFSSGDSPIAPRSKFAYVARVSNDNYSFGTPTYTGSDLALMHAVAPGDALVVTVVLTDSGPGTVAVTDSAGNNYVTAADSGAMVNRDRLLIFVLVNSKPLDSLSKISIRWPWATDDHIAVDEFRGIDHAAGSWTSESSTDPGSGSFTVSDPLPRGEDDLMFSAVSTRTTGAAPGLGDGWTPLADLRQPAEPEQPNHISLTTGYRTVPPGGRCTMRVTAPAPWQATVLRLR